MVIKRLKHILLSWSWSSSTVVELASSTFERIVDSLAAPGLVSSANFMDDSDGQTVVYELLDS